MDGSRLQAWAKTVAAMLTVAASIAAALVAFFAWRTANEAESTARQSLQEAQRTGQDERDTNAVLRKQLAALQAAAAESTATFTDPPQLAHARECLLVPQSGLTVAGKALMLHGQELWILVRPPLDPTFYIASGEPLNVSPDTHDWSAFTNDIGGPDDHGATFELLLVAASINGSTIIQSGYQKDGQVHTLPPGADDVIQTACVKRE